MEPDELAKAYVRGRRARVDVARTLRVVAIALAVGTAAAIAGWTWLAAVGGVVVLVAAVVWGLQRYVAREEEEAWAASQPGPIPEGERVYPLRPRLAAAAVMVVSSAIAAAALTGIVVDSSEDRALVGGSAGVVAGVALASFLVAVVRRPQIRVTDTAVEVPRSFWRGGVVAIPLELVGVRVWGHPSSPSVEVSGLGAEYDFSEAFLGEEAFREFVAVVKHRASQARAQLADRSSGDG